MEIGDAMRAAKSLLANVNITIHPCCTFKFSVVAPQKSTCNIYQNKFSFKCKSITIELCCWESGCRENYKEG